MRHTVVGCCAAELDHCCLIIKRGEERREGKEREATRREEVWSYDHSDANGHYPF